MNKIIRMNFDRNLFKKNKYNNLFRIDNELAVAKNLVMFSVCPQRKKLRNQIIQRCNKMKDIPFKVTHRDIKRLERASKCEISVNSAFILRAIIEEIHDVRANYRYRAPDNDILSVYQYMINLSWVCFSGLYLKISNELFNSEVDQENCMKFNEEINYLMKGLIGLSESYNYCFNELFV